MEKTTMNNKEALDLIHKELDGEEWSPDTCEAIAHILTLIGYDIREPEEEEID